MLKLFEQNMSYIICSGTILLVILIAFKIYKFRRLIDQDAKYKKTDKTGNIIQETYPRPIWDYNFFPGISKLWHRSESQTLLAMLFMALLLVLYVITRADGLLNLLAINFGAFIGMMIKWKDVN